MGKPLNERTLYERLMAEFTDLHRARSAISLAVEKLQKFDYEDPNLDLEDEVQLVVDTLLMASRSIYSIATEVEVIALDG